MTDIPILPWRPGAAGAFLVTLDRAGVPTALHTFLRQPEGPDGVFVGHAHVAAAVGADHAAIATGHITADGQARFYGSPDPAVLAFAQGAEPRAVFDDPEMFDFGDVWS